MKNWLMPAAVGVSTFGLMSVLLVKQVVSSNTTAESFFIDGRIDSSVAQEYVDSGNFRFLEVNSSGGDGLAALVIAETMVEHKTILRIKGNCISACAEFLIPAAHAVIAIDEPVVAVHGNPILLKRLYSETNTPIPRTCSKQMDGLETIYETMDRSTDLALSQREKLGLVSFKTQFNPLTECFDYSWRFRKFLWMPTSDDYSKLMGVKIDGPLCADDTSCVGRRITSSSSLRICNVGGAITNC